MTEPQMRKWVKKAYDNPTWAAKVDKMQPKQVICLYYKFLKEGKFEKPKKLKKTDVGYQMTVFDYI